MMIPLSSRCFTLCSVDAFPTMLFPKRYLNYCLLRDLQGRLLQATCRFKVTSIIPSGQMIPDSSVESQNQLLGSSKMKNELTEEPFVQARNEIVDCNPLSGIAFGNSLMDTQTNNHQMSPSQIEIEKYSQIQCQISSLEDVNPLVSGTRTPFGFNKNFLKNAAVNVASQTVGRRSSIYHRYIVNQHDNVFTSEDWKLLVQSPQLQSSHALNMSPVDCPQTQPITNDFRPFSFIADDIIACSNSLGVNHMQPLVCVDYLENGNHPDIDKNSNDIPTSSVENFSLSKSIGFSMPPSSVVGGFELQVPGLRSPSGIYETRTSQNMFIGDDVKINRDGRLDWEVENATGDSVLSQFVSSTRIQGYSQIASGFDALNDLRCQQRKVSNPVAEQCDRPSQVASEAEPLSTVSSTQCQRICNIVDNGLEFEGENISD